MAISDQLSKLAARTKQLEDRATAARQEARADLQHDVEAALEAANANAEVLGKAVDAQEAEVSAWWTGIGRSWDQHIAHVRERVQTRKDQHDLKAAQRAADEATEYASYLIDYTYAAVEEAEYAVLDATLAQMEADELAAQQAS
jgi:UDP-N-acetyl-D-mannosaminuronate dehydrogenase